MTSTTRTVPSPSSGTSAGLRNRLPGVATVMWLDAVASGAMGLGLVVTAAFAERWFGLPGVGAVGIGAFLVVWALFVASVARNPRPTVVREVALLNIGWVAVSLGFALVDPVGLTTLGLVLVIAQAVAVADLVVLSLLATRRAT